MSAHTVSTSHLAVVSAPDEPVSIELDLAVRDLALVVDLDADADGTITWREVRSNAAEIGERAATAVVLQSAEGECPLAAAAPAIRRYADGAYVSSRLTSTCPRSAVESIALGEWLAQDRSHRMTVTSDDGAVAPVVLDRAAPAVALHGAGGGTFGTFFREGIQHILEGYDHLAFVLSLLLPVVLAGASRRRPRDAFRQAALIVTAFTLAHSVTLSMAALGVVSPAPRFVEAAIAASISLAALNNVFRIVDRHVAWLAGACGFIHGFGFAGALAELGLPAGSRLTALFAFNLGVEAGQLAVVLVALPLLSLAATRPGYRRMFLAPASLALATLGGFWFVARSM